MPSAADLARFSATGILVTAGIEWLATRGWSWFPRTQFGQAWPGRAASYVSIAARMAGAVHSVVIRETLNGMCTPRPSRP